MTGRTISWRAALFFAIALAAPAVAAPRSAGDADVAQCIRQSAQGRKWLEITLWGLRDREGGWIGAETPNRNGTADLGPMQVNSWWVPRLAALIGGREPDVRRWLTHDACFNVDAARWIFLTALASTGDYWSAIGAYHSPVPARRWRYARAVAAAMRTRFGAGLFITSRTAVESTQ